MGQQTWAGAIGEVWRAAVRHKVISGLIALCVAGSLAGIALAGSASGASGQPAQPADVAAPAFSLPVLGHSGQHVSLGQYSGRPLIVNFFASWCDPCKTETPLLAKFYRTEKGKVALVGLDENDVLGNAMSFTRANGVTYPVGWDPQFERRVGLRCQRAAADVLPRRPAPHRGSHLRRGDARGPAEGDRARHREGLTARERLANGTAG